MTPFETYRAYIALKRHFEPGSSYDFIKYQGKTNASLNSFESRPDRMWFEKLAKHENPLSFLIANLSINPKAYIRDLSYSAEAQRKYEERERRLQSLSYTVVNELSSVGDSLTNMVRVDSGTHSSLLRAYMAGTVSIETLCALESLASFTKAWKRAMEWEPITKKTCETIAKSKPFLTIDKEAVRAALLKKFTH